MNRRHFLLASTCLAYSGFWRPTEAASRSPVIAIEAAHPHSLARPFVEATKNIVAQRWPSQNIRWELLNHQGNIDRALDGFRRLAAQSDCLCVVGGLDWNITPILVREAARLRLPYWLSGCCLKCGRGSRPN